MQGLDLPACVTSDPTPEQRVQPCWPRWCPAAWWCSEQWLTVMLALSRACSACRWMRCCARHEPLLCAVAHTAAQRRHRSHESLGAGQPAVSCVLQQALQKGTTLHISFYQEADSSTEQGGGKKTLHIPRVPEHTATACKDTASADLELLALLMAEHHLAETHRCAGHVRCCPLRGVDALDKSWSQADSLYTPASGGRAPKAQERLTLSCRLTPLSCRFSLLTGIRRAMGFADLETRRTLVQVRPVSARQGVCRVCRRGWPDSMPWHLLART